MRPQRPKLHLPLTQVCKGMDGGQKVMAFVGRELLDPCTVGIAIDKAIAAVLSNSESVYEAIRHLGYIRQELGIVVKNLEDIPHETSNT